jgi:hypothetical protein
MKKQITLSILLAMFTSCRTSKEGDIGVEDDYDYVVRDTIYNINGTIISSPIYSKRK